MSTASYMRFPRFLINNLLKIIKAYFCKGGCSIKDSSAFYNVSMKKWSIIFNHFVCQFPFHKLEFHHNINTNIVQEDVNIVNVN